MAEFPFNSMMSTSSSGLAHDPSDVAENSRGFPSGGLPFPAAGTRVRPLEDGRSLLASGRWGIDGGYAPSSPVGGVYMPPLTPSGYLNCLRVHADPKRPDPLRWQRHGIGRFRSSFGTISPGSVARSQEESGYTRIPTLSIFGTNPCWGTPSVPGEPAAHPRTFGTSLKVSNPPSGFATGNHPTVRLEAADRSFMSTHTESFTAPAVPTPHAVQQVAKATKPANEARALAATTIASW